MTGSTWKGCAFSESKVWATGCKRSGEGLRVICFSSVVGEVDLLVVESVFTCWVGVVDRLGELTF